MRYVLILGVWLVAGCRTSDLGGDRSEAGGMDAGGVDASGCSADRDCARRTPRCDVASRRCVACLPLDDNCGPGLVCASVDGAYACTSTCTRSADCLKLMGGGECCDGKCVNTMTDTANCGGCGRACRPYHNADCPCSGGQCGCSCPYGFVDCNKSDADGCETDVNGDVDNCGGCGMRCGATPNGTAICQTGACVSLCNMGYADCNGALKDGCEVDISSDPNNCGTCGKVCPAPANAIAACDAGNCAFRCKPHFFDCDGNAANGCEVDASSDPNNCGHCGNICPFNKCVNSWCQ